MGKVYLISIHDLPSLSLTNIHTLLGYEILIGQ